MTKLDDLKTLHRDLNQMSARVETIKAQVTNGFPNEAVALNEQLDIVAEAVSEAKTMLRALAGTEAMKNGGTAP